MSKAKKRRTDHGCNLEELQMPPPVCILHVSGIQHGEFIPLHNIRGPPQEKLEMLHNLREKRLLQSHDSPARMEAVCRLIPDNLDGVDLEMTGYHRGCYQAFTKHQDRLKCVVPDDEPSTIRSPRKPSTSSKNIFPPECIFCEMLETKVSGRTERCVQFASFKGKEAAWTHIESQALEVGDNRLHRKVAGEDLFAREARFHKSCHSSFKLRHVNYLRDQANRSIENKQDEKLEAHQSSFYVVLYFIRERVIGQMEVVQLGTLRHLYVQDIFLDNGTGKHRQIVNTSQMAESMGADNCKMVLGLYVFTGEDVTSSFKGKGKIGPLKKLQRHPIYHEAFRLWIRCLERFWAERNQNFEEERCPADDPCGRETNHCLQGNVFWRRFVYCFKLYIQKYLYPKCKIEDRTPLMRCVEEMQDYIFFNYCNAKFVTARAFMNNLIILGLSTERIASIGKGYTKDPFYGKQTRGTYRGLFGHPDSPVTYLKAMLIQPMYLRFFHAVITLMRVWQGSPDCSDDDESYCPRYIIEEMFVDRIKKIAESSSEDESSNSTTSSQNQQEHEQLKDEELKKTENTNNTEKPKTETQPRKVSRKTLKANAFAAKKLSRMNKASSKKAEPDTEYYAIICVRRGVEYKSNNEEEEKEEESCSKVKRKHDHTAAPLEPRAEQLADLEDFTIPDFYFQQASHHDEDLTFEFEFMTMDDGSEGDLSDVVRFHECTSCFTFEHTPDVFKQCKRCKTEHWLLPKYYCSQKCQDGDWRFIHRQEHQVFKNDHLEPRRQNVFWP